MIVSDHGQSQGATFLQRYGSKLEDVVRELMGGDSVLAATSTVEGWGPVNAALDQLMGQSGLIAASRAGAGWPTRRSTARPRSGVR